MVVSWLWNAAQEAFLRRFSPWLQPLAKHVRLWAVLKGAVRPAWRRGVERMSDSIRTSYGSFVMASGAGWHAGRGQVEPESNA